MLNNSAINFSSCSNPYFAARLKFAGKNNKNFSGQKFLQQTQQDIFEKQNQDANNQAYREVYAHEAAHKAAAGSFGGAIVIDKNSDGMITGGHVDIKMPVLNEENPDETINHANTVIKAAMAPSDPSSQDYKVASEAKSILNSAKQAKNKLNLMA